MLEKSQPISIEFYLLSFLNVFEQSAKDTQGKRQNRNPIIIFESSYTRRLKISAEAQSLCECKYFCAILSESLLCFPLHYKEKHWQGGALLEFPWRAYVVYNQQIIAFKK